MKLEMEKRDSKEGFKQFLELKTLNDSTIACYSRYYRLLKPLIDELGLTQEIIDTWLIEHKNHKQIRAFVRNYLEFIDNIEIRLRRQTGKSSPKKRIIMTDDEIHQAVTYMYNHNYKYGIMVHLMSDTGIRRAEALGVNPEDFEWDKWLKNPELRCKLKIRGKGRKERFVMVSSIVMDALRYYADNNSMAEGQQFIRMNRTSLTEQFERACESILGRKFTPHDIRRYTANKWFREGLKLEQIKIRLGHQSVKTTELYVQPSESAELNLWQQE